MPDDATDFALTTVARRMRQRFSQVLGQAAIPGAARALATLDQPGEGGALGPGDASDPDGPEA